MNEETNDTPISESPPPDQGPIGQGTPGQEPPDQEPVGLSSLPVEEQVVALREHLEEARQEAAQNWDSTLRAQAELANFRRRTDEERISLGKYSNGRLIAKLLPMMAELALAVSPAPASASPDAGSAPQAGHAPETGASWETSWLEGVKLIQRKFENLLESEGVAVIESVGVAFNPLEHEALGTEETKEYPPGYVTQALRQGYRLHDRIIQPAQVIVAREPQVQGEGDPNVGDKESGNG